MALSNGTPETLTGVGLKGKVRNGGVTVKGVSVGPLVVSAVMGSAVLFVNHGASITVGKLPGWWMILLTYLMVHLAFALGVLCAKLQCTMCFRKMVGVPVEMPATVLKTFTCTEMEDHRIGVGEDPLQLGESVVPFPSDGGDEGTQHDDSVVMENMKSIYALTQRASFNQSQSREVAGSSQAEDHCSCSVSQEPCSTSNSACFDTENKTGGATNARGSLKIPPGRGHFHESASSFFPEQIRHILEPELRSESWLDTVSRSPSHLHGESEEHVTLNEESTIVNMERVMSVPEIVAGSVEEPIESMKRCGATPKERPAGTLRSQFAPRISVGESGSRRSLAFLERRFAGSMSSVERLMTYQNSLYIDDSMPHNPCLHADAI